MARKQHNSLRRRLIKLRGHRCQLEDCGYEEVVELHHIVNVSEGGDNSDDNCILLCPNCHRLAHKGQISIIELLETNGCLVDF